jgi:hypothetical protein
MATQNSGNVSITGGNISGITLSGYGQLSGTNSWSGGNTFSSGVNLTSNTSVYAASSVQLNIDVNGSRSMTLFGSLTNFSNGHFAPQSDATYTCGTNIARWSAIWSTNATIQTSDQRLKTDITNSQLGLSFINKLRPVSYKWIVGGNAITGYVEEEIKDESGKVIRISKVPQLSPMPGVRTHYGLISQEVKAAIDSENVGDFAGWVLSDKDEPTSTQNLRYGEFISPMIKAIQELSAKVNTLEAELAALKGN